MPRVLIVAYGNPLRRDDGIAWRAADAFESKFSGYDVEILRLHQLAPEVAEAVQHRDLILFLDAALGDVINSTPGQIRINELSQRPDDEDHAGLFSHVYSPARILSLARELYQASPKAFVITVAGEHFDHGDNLSDAVAAAIPSLIAKVEQIVKEQIETAREH